MNGVLCNLGIDLHTPTRTSQGMWSATRILTRFLPNPSWTHYSCAHRCCQLSTLIALIYDTCHHFLTVKNHSDTSPREDSKRTHNYMHTVTVTFLNPVLSLPLCIRLTMTSSDASATVLVVGILLNHTNFTLVPNHTKL